MKVTLSKVVLTALSDARSYRYRVSESQLDLV